MQNPLEFVRTAKIDMGVAALEAEKSDDSLNAIDVNNLPEGLVIGKTLLDLSNVVSPLVRGGISLSMLFASRVATNDSSANDEDSWLASYQSALGELGFGLGGTARLNSSFKKLDVAVHKSIIPFLTIAFGGAGVGPIILAALENLGKIESGSPWITLFDREARRFSVKEMHFGAAIPAGIQTEIRYAVARLDVELGETKVLFFKVTKNTAQFESMTTRMVADNSLMAAMESELKLRLSKQIKHYVWSANVE